MSLVSNAPITENKITVSDATLYETLTGGSLGATALDATEIWGYTSKVQVELFFASTEVNDLATTPIPDYTLLLDVDMTNAESVFKIAPAQLDSRISPVSLMGASGIMTNIFWLYNATVTWNQNGLGTEQSTPLTNQNLHIMARRFIDSNQTLRYVVLNIARLSLLGTGVTFAPPTCTTFTRTRAASRTTTSNALQQVTCNSSNTNLLFGPVNTASANEVGLENLLCVSVGNLTRNNNNLVTVATEVSSPYVLIRRVVLDSSLQAAVPYQVESNVFLNGQIQFLFSADWTTLISYSNTAGTPLQTGFTLVPDPTDQSGQRDPPTGPDLMAKTCALRPPGLAVVVYVIGGAVTTFLNGNEKATATYNPAFFYMAFGLPTTMETSSGAIVVNAPVADIRHIPGFPTPFATTAARNGLLGGTSTRTSSVGGTSVVRTSNGSILTSNGSVLRSSGSCTSGLCSRSRFV